MNDSTSSLKTGYLLTDDGIPMACDMGGKGQKLLLFIHGWTCRRKYWQAQLEGFKESWRVAAPDLPGHGDTSAGNRQNLNIRALAKDVKACAGAIASEQTVLIGHSMGGAVALETAIIMGERVRAVILVDTFVIDYGGLDNQTTHAIAAPFETDFAEAMAALIENTSTEATPEHLRKCLIKEMSRANPDLVLPLWRDLLGWSPSAAFKALTIPIHAINGALIPESARERCSPYLKETIIPGAGHFLHMENPGQFNLVLGQVLDRTG